MTQFGKTVLTFYSIIALIYITIKSFKSVENGGKGVEAILLIPTLILLLNSI